MVLYTERGSKAKRTQKIFLKRVILLPVGNSFEAQETAAVIRHLERGEPAD